MDVPARKDGILSRRLGDEWLLYDPASGAVHVVNSVAAFVWDMCDGSHTLERMEAKVREAYDVSEGATVRGDVEDILRSFEKMGLLREGVA